MIDPFAKDWSKPDATINVNVNVNVQGNPPPPVKHTDITIVLDKSGSMGQLRDTVIESLNENIRKIKEQPGDTKWSLVTFDDRDSAKGANEQFPQTVFEKSSEKDMRYLKQEDYVPRGGTALVDAVCLTMRQVSARISGNEANVKPVMMIVTDGLENASREFNTAKMREMIARREQQGWGFQFLAANQDAWATANNYGMANNSSYSASASYSGCVTSGAVASGAANSFTFAMNSQDLRRAICSGMTGCFDQVSGAFRDPAKVSV